ncbi:MAG TPA: metalloregulator ArsR/SmtB family transcription factor [Spirochaetia bacterium]|nr:metalloregulator ArsR/SmtB family transcription factor [Spirochaetia bacterium]
MPLQIPASHDPITPLVLFQTSEVFEMLMSLQSVVDSFHHPEWTQTVRSELGNRFVNELTEFYHGFQDGSLFLELGVDAPDTNDIPSFIDHIAQMDLARFAFFMTGRLCPVEQIPDPLSRAGLERMLLEADLRDSSYYSTAALQWADDAPAHRATLVGLWRTYYDKFYVAHAKEFLPCAQKSVHERREQLEQQGGTSLYTDIAGCDLPDPIPSDQPYREIRFVPVYRTNRRRMSFFGYGLMTVIYDCSRTEEYERSIETDKNRAVELMRALADDTRLAVLRVIAQHPSSNGRKISERVELSPSVVSRHLKQLKEAGLIIEDSPDNRNITYKLVYEKITEVPDKVIRYLRD